VAPFYAPRCGNAAAVVHVYYESAKLSSVFAIITNVVELTAVTVTTTYENLPYESLQPRNAEQSVYDRLRRTRRR